MDRLQVKKLGVLGQAKDATFGYGCVSGLERKELDAILPAARSDVLRWIRHMNHRQVGTRSGDKCAKPLDPTQYAFPRQFR